MEKNMEIFIFISFLYLGVSFQILNTLPNSSYTLGSNLVTNGDFSAVSVGTGKYVDYLFSTFNSAFPPVSGSGWGGSGGIMEINEPCYWTAGGGGVMPYMCNNIKGLICSPTNNMIDLETCSNYNVSNTLQLNSGLYLVSFSWMNLVSSLLFYNSFNFYINKNTIFQMSKDLSCTMHTESYYLNVTATGTFELLFEGLGWSDCVGAYIDNINVQLVTFNSPIITPTPAPTPTPTPTPAPISSSNQTQNNSSTPTSNSSTPSSNAPTPTPNSSTPTPNQIQSNSSALAPSNQTQSNSNNSSNSSSMISQNNSSSPLNSQSQGQQYSDIFSPSNYSS